MQEEVEEELVLNLDVGWMLWEGMPERRGRLVMMYYERYVTKVMTLKCMVVKNAILNFKFYCRVEKGFRQADGWR